MMINRRGVTVFVEMFFKVTFIFIFIVKIFNFLNFWKFGIGAKGVFEEGRSVRVG